MNGPPDWLPDMLEFTGDWDAFVDAVYARFVEDLVRHQVQFRGLRVGVRHHPASRGKGHGFWHCVSEGGLEDERTPDLDRCRRIGWIRAIIENATRADVQHWTNQRGGETRHLLWFREEYLVVLAERQGYYLLKSAYPTNREHTRGKLRRERDQAKNG